MNAPTTGSAPPKLDNALIERLFGAETLAYLERKHRGGTNGKKGTRYEDLFATSKIAEILATHVQQGGPLPVVEEQAFGFVDDLAVAEATATKYFQCKNSASVSWSGGSHPIEADFENQITLAGALQKPSPTAELVVSDSDTAEKLAAEIPKSIGGSASVAHFPYFERVNQLVFSHKTLQDMLSKLTRMEDPKVDDLEAAFSALLLGWIKVSGSSKLDDLVHAARQQSPQLLRVFPISDEAVALSDEFVNALAGISGLSYSVKRGFFSWAAGGVVETLNCDCKSGEFARFQQRVIQAKPQNIDDFWEQLP